MGGGPPARAQQPLLGVEGGQRSTGPLVPPHARPRRAHHALLEHVADRKGHDFRYSVDIGKIADELGYAPQVPFEQGLADVVQWYRDHRSWWEPLKERAAL